MCRVGRGRTAGVEGEREDSWCRGGKGRTTVCRGGKGRTAGVEGRGWTGTTWTGGGGQICNESGAVSD